MVPAQIDEVFFDLQCSARECGWAGQLAGREAYQGSNPWGHERGDSVKA